MKIVIPGGGKNLKWNLMEFYNPDNYCYWMDISWWSIVKINKALCESMQKNPISSNKPFLD